MEMDRQSQHKKTDKDQSRQQGRSKGESPANQTRKVLAGENEKKK